MTGTGNCRTERKSGSIRLRWIAACVILQCVGTAGATGVRPAVPCPCEADGVCRPNRLEWGYYHTNWRRWPGDMPSAAEAGAEAEEQLKEELPGFQRPEPIDEDLRGPAQPDRGKDDEDEAAAGDDAPLDNLPGVPPLQGGGPVLSLPIAAGVAAPPATTTTGIAGPAYRPYMPAPEGLYDPFEVIPDPAIQEPKAVQPPVVQPTAVQEPVLQDMPPVLPPSLGARAETPVSHGVHAVEPAGAVTLATDSEPTVAEPPRQTFALVNPIAQRVVRTASVGGAGNVQTGSVQAAVWAGDEGGVRPASFGQSLPEQPQATDEH